MRKRKKSKSENEAEMSTTTPNQSLKERALHFVLVVMVVVCVLIVISAFVCILDANLKIYDMKAEVSNYLGAKGITAEIKKAGQCFIDRLEAYCKSLMEASTVSFLVAILSAGVIAFAVSLINRGHQDIRDIKDKIEILSNEVRKEVNATKWEVEELKAKTKDANETVQKTKEDAQTSLDRFYESVVLNLEATDSLLKAQQSSQELRRTVDDKSFDSLVPHVRDLLTYVYEVLKFAKDKDMKLGSELCQDFRKETLNIKMDLDGVPEESKDKVEDLIERCDKIIELLKQLCTDEKQ